MRDIEAVLVIVRHSLGEQGLELVRGGFGTGSVSVSESLVKGTEYILEPELALGCENGDIGKGGDAAAHVENGALAVGQ